MNRWSSTIAIALLAVAIAGCGKKQKAETVPDNADPVATVKTADTSDVFSEFYTEARDTGKKSSPTFSMNEPASFVPAFSRVGAYVTQVATMASRRHADELARELKAKGYPAYVTEVENPRPDLNGTFFRVRIGRFATITDARNFGENVLKPANYTFWVDRKSNDKAPGENRSPQPVNKPLMAPTPAQPAPAPTGQNQEPAPAPSGNWGSSGWQDNSGSW